MIAACSDDGSSVAGATSAGQPEQSGPGEATTTQPPSTAQPTDTAQAPATTTDVVDPLRVVDFEGVGGCDPLPAQGEGPFYLDEDLVRANIIEDRTGTPLRIGIRVVDRDCVAVAGVAVDIWHCDSLGDYSAFVDGSVDRGEAGPGTTFLRGTQVTDADGIVEFLTVWPGWYPGRTVHIHLKVRDGANAFTTQMYFDEDATTAVYQNEPYSFRGLRSVFNGSDGIAGNPERDGLIIGTTAATTPIGEGHLGLFVAAVDL